MKQMKGATLIEVLIALAIASIVIVAITIVSITSLRNAQFVQKSDQATKYAQEGMEIMRSIRNGDYQGFQSYSGTYCLDDGQTTLGIAQSSCTTENIGSFIRSVKILPSGCGANVSQVTVTVSWRDGQCDSESYCHKSDLVSCLSTESIN